MEPTGIAALLGAVLVASLLGSAHCAGMCGGLALFAVNADGSLRRSWPLQIGYQLGRGVAYTLIGISAGIVGAAVDFAALAAGWQHTAAAAAGSAMVVMGIASLAAMHGLRAKGRASRSQWYSGLVESIHRAAFALPGIARAWGVGLLTPLLPCGWLYVFAVAAAGTGSPIIGGLVMAAFWMGTLPVMAGIALGLQALTGPLRRRVPALSAVVIIAMGLLTAMGRLALPTFTPPEELAAQPSAIGASLSTVRSLDHREVPCCNPDASEPGS